MKNKSFDASEYLDNDEVIVEYLNAALETGDPDALLMALANVVKARGMAKIAEDAGVGRESLYKTLTPGTKPRYDTIVKVLGALGISVRVQINDDAA